MLTTYTFPTFILATYMFPAYTCLLPFFVLFFKKKCQSVLGDLARPPPGGHGVGLLYGYHPGGVGTKTKVA